MKKNLILLPSLILIIGCSTGDINKEKINITLYESYDLIDLFPMLVNANDLIKENKPEHSSLVEEFDVDVSDSTYNPLFDIFLLNVRTGGYLYPTTLLGWTIDTVKLRKYLIQTDTVFPDYLIWKLSHKQLSNYTRLYAFIQNGYKVILKESDIDSVLVATTGGPWLFKTIFRNTHESESRSDYLVKIKLKRELTGKLGAIDYSFFMKIHNNEYSGSIIDFKNNPDQYVLLGEMYEKDYKVLKNRLKGRIKKINKYP